MKTYLLIFCWIPVAASYIGAGQTGFGTYFICSLWLIAFGTNVCTSAFVRAGSASQRRIEDEMKLAALLSVSEAEWNQRVMAVDLFLARGEG